MNHLSDLRNKIDDWERSWVIMPEDDPRREDLVREIREIGESQMYTDTYALLAPWLDAFEASLVEQKKYQAWYNDLAKASGNAEEVAKVHAARVAMLQAYKDSNTEDLAPDWISMGKYFNPRHGPAMAVCVKDESSA